MARTLFDKIWKYHFVASRPDGHDLIYIDRHVMHELHAPHAFLELEKSGRTLRRPDPHDVGAGTTRCLHGPVRCGARLILTQRGSVQGNSASG